MCHLTPNPGIEAALKKEVPKVRNIVPAKKPPCWTLVLTSISLTTTMTMIMTMTTTINQVHAMDIVSVQLAVADKFTKQGKCPIVAVVSHLSKGTVTSLEKPHILMGRARQRAEKKQVCNCMCVCVCVCVCVLTPVSPSYIVYLTFSRVHIHLSYSTHASPTEPLTY